MRLLVIGGSDADLVLVVVGVRPDTQLAVAAGMDTGVGVRCGSTGACAPTCPTSWPPLGPS